MANLYDKCSELLDRLTAVPGFREAFLVEDLKNSLDPVNRLWDCLRSGAPLCFLVNYLYPDTIPTVHPPQQARATSNLAKANIYHFLLGCKTVLNIDDSILFTIRDLVLNDTNGFIRVLRTLEMVMQRVEIDSRVCQARDQRLSSLNPSADHQVRLSMDSARNNSEKVIAELLETERKYVADLECLQDYKRLVFESQIVPEPTIRQIFGNLDQLVDFQRKFLVGIEDACRASNRAERIAELFEVNEDNFSVYGPYCANHRAAADMVLTVAPELAKLKKGIEPNYDLPSFLIKPIQRICKYPLLLRELDRFTPEALIHLKSLLNGAGEAVNRVTNLINELRRREENATMVQALEKRVEDWKGFNIHNFGNLLLDINLIMLRRDTEREMHVFLFERILICCKEIKKEKKRSLSISRPKTNSISTEKMYQLKGGVAVSQMESVIVSIRDGTPEIQVLYKDSESGEMESFVLKFLNEEQAKIWQRQFESLIVQVKRCSSIDTSSNRSRKSSMDQRRATAALSGRRDQNEIFGEPSSSTRLPNSDYTYDQKCEFKRRETWTLEQAMSELGAFKEDSFQNENSPPRTPVTPNSERMPLKPATSTNPPILAPNSEFSSLKAKVHFQDDIFALMIDSQWTYLQLWQTIIEKLSEFDQAAATKIKYKDEDGDYISIRTNGDLALAIKLCVAGGHALNLYLQ